MTRAHGQAAPAGGREPTADLAWFKSSYSDGTGNNCVEIADARTAVGVRDSKQENGPVLLVSRARFAAFVADVRESSAAASEVMG
ncbi:DUF397 domain-containing protein [Streptomyces sp. NPDC048717]|uniref:DUF397 domain-containing protein n=1 Tax=Streptomyces sp. NPDC048717 TaxID=3154928 RepID=UPI00341FEB7D